MRVLLCLLSLAACAAQDPKCLNGVKSGSLCCLKSCGTCGGSGCSSRPGGPDGCCGSNVAGNGKSCNQSPAPCSLGSGKPFEGQFAKPSGSKLRVASYNCFRSSIFPNNIASGPKVRSDNFARIAKAVKADIWAFQEMFYGSTQTQAKAEGVANYMQQLTGIKWYIGGDHATSTPGEFLLSRYPITWQQNVAGRTYGVLINLPTEISSKKLLILNNHFMSDGHGAEAGKFLKKISPTSTVSGVPADANILVVGDFNAVVGSTRYNSVQGAIPNLLDLHSYHLNTNVDAGGGGVSRKTTGDPETASWTHGGGRIDFLLYRKSDLAVSNSFILNTFTMDRTVLTQNGMKRVDVALEPHNCGTSALSCATDHLPQIVDFGGSGPYKASAEEPLEARAEEDGYGIDEIDDDSGDDLEANGAAGRDYSWALAAIPVIAALAGR